MTFFLSSGQVGNSVEQDDGFGNPLNTCDANVCTIEVWRLANLFVFEADYLL